ncbi:MAG: two pore domain potassium channel family protein [Chitinophagaceae bacterium]|nr:two pore domain potassium channel family protein [Chitinophagaceae bacterium]
MNFITKLIMGTNRPESKPRSVYLKETLALRQIWHNRSYNDFGLERILRLVLMLLSFIMPGTFIRQLCGRKQLLIRKVVIEAYSLFKISWYFFLFRMDLTTSLTALIISLILTIDTVHFMFSKIFLNDIHRQPISFKRTLLMTLINILEIIICFAFIYSYIDDSNTIPGRIIFSAGHPLTDLQTIYFSFVTSATIGYGDIAPVDPLVIKLVVIQIMLSLFFLVIVITTITNRLHDDTFYNKRKDTYR